MYIELHMIQNFAPSNLNRDDTGAPKDCDFGGVRRARISSQCLKRAIRDNFKRNTQNDSSLLTENDLAVRTRLLVEEKLSKNLENIGHDKEQAIKVAITILAAAGIKVEKNKKNGHFESEYMLNVADNEIQELTNLCDENWDSLKKIIEASQPDDTENEDAKSRKRQKKKAKEAIPSEISKKVKEILTKLRKASDLALFGRMIANLPEGNIDAACQVAHAISTHKVSMEFDFYTAVDDLNPKEDTGAGMMGTVEFNSACFYRYANIDIGQLVDNLGGDVDLAKKTVEAFIRASKEAIPTGKQNSFAAQNPPSFILAVVRNNGAPLSLANAFENPVRPNNGLSLVESSIDKLDAHWKQLADAYGEDGVELFATQVGGKPQLTNLPQPKPFEEMVKNVMSKLVFK